MAREEKEREEVRTREIILEELQEKCIKNGWNYEDKKTLFIKSEEAKKKAEREKELNKEKKAKGEVIGEHTLLSIEYKYCDEWEELEG